VSGFLEWQNTSQNIIEKTFCFIFQHLFSKRCFCIKKAIEKIALPKDEHIFLAMCHVWDKNR
jgi:hypothetical protein